MKNTIFSLMLLTLFTSCGSTYNAIVNKPDVRPVHGGELLKGKDFYLEVVGTEDKVEFYPMKYDEEEKKLVSIPIKDLDVEATYAYLHHEKKEGRNDRPTPKGATTIQLDPLKDGFEGKVKARDTDGYVVNFKLQDDKDKENFRYEVDI